MSTVLLQWRTPLSPEEHSQWRNWVVLSWVILLSSQQKYFRNYFLSVCSSLSFSSRLFWEKTFCILVTWWLLAGFSAMSLLMACRRSIRQTLKQQHFSLTEILQFCCRCFFLHPHFLLILQSFIPIGFQWIESWRKEKRKRKERKKEIAEGKSAIFCNSQQALTAVSFLTWSWGHLCLSNYLLLENLQRLFKLACFKWM